MHLRLDGSRIHVSPVKGRANALIPPRTFLCYANSDEDIIVGSKTRELKQEQRSKYTVLVVDDECDIRLLLDFTLSQLGYKIKLAENGQWALKICETEKIDIILTDIMMPIMDGIKFIEMLERAKKNYPIIILSAVSDIEQKISASMIKGRIIKPVNIDDLRIAIDNIAISVLDAEAASKKQD